MLPNSHVKPPLVINIRFNKSNTDSRDKENGENSQRHECTDTDRKLYVYAKSSNGNRF
uniref:Uncharacterized protein n=1 Tax=Arion vulgaris TaxID=1028688 RepID=A0A0B7BW96_9EUPU